MQSTYELEQKAQALTNAIHAKRMSGAMEHTDKELHVMVMELNWIGSKLSQDGACDRVGN